MIAHCIEHSNFNYHEDINCYEQSGAARSKIVEKIVQCGI